VILRLVACAAALPLLAPAAAAASRSRPPVALAATPAHLRIAGSTRQTIRVANTGAATVEVDVGAAGYALDPRGRPRVLERGPGARPPSTWLRAEPASLTLPPGAKALVQVSASPPRSASPGDHAALVLLTTRPKLAAAVALRMQIGVTVAIRVPGKIVHRLSLAGVRVRRGRADDAIALTVRNRGNAIEVLLAGRLRIVLLARGRVVARMRSARRELLPHTSTVFELRHRLVERGPVSLRVALTTRNSTRTRVFRLRL
jgi:hypothetical protein